MDIEKLEQLAKLKESGIITQEEFNKEKDKLILTESTDNINKKKKKGTSTVLSVIGILFIIACVGLNTFTYKCDDKSLLKGDLLEAINNTPLLKWTQVTAIYASGATEKKYDKDKKIRYCNADVNLSNGNKVSVDYKLIEKDDQYLIETNIVD